MSSTLHTRCLAFLIQLPSINYGGTQFHFLLPSPPPHWDPPLTHSLLVEKLQVRDNVMADTTLAQKLHGWKDEGKPLYMHFS